MFDKNFIEMIEDLDEKGSIIEKDNMVKEFIIEQHSPSHFKVVYVSSDALSNKKKETIKKEMESYLESGLDITFERQASIERSKSGKLKQFTSLIK